MRSEKRIRAESTPGRKLWIFVSGWGTILVGIILLPLPGPGTLIIFAGISLLAMEFRWARRLRIVVWRKARRAINAAKSKSKSLDDGRRNPYVNQDHETKMSVSDGNGDGQ